MGEHNTDPKRIYINSPLKILRLYELALERDQNVFLEALAYVQRRECLKVSEDMMRLCCDTEIGII